MTRHTINVPLVDDDIFELTKALTASLVFTDTPSPPRMTLAPAVANIAIFDDDGEESIHTSLSYVPLSPSTSLPLSISLQCT